MSTHTLQLKLITPEKTVFEGTFDHVTIPTTEGEIGVYPEHVALVTLLASGDIVGYTNNEPHPFTVVGGSVTIEHNIITVLADFAEHVSVSLDQIETARARAAELMKQKENAETVDFEALESELERSLTRVKVADKWKNKKYRM